MHEWCRNASYLTVYLLPHQTLMGPLKEHAWSHHDETWNTVYSSTRFANTQLLELMGWCWVEEGSKGRHARQHEDISEESGLAHSSTFHRVYCKFSNREFPCSGCRRLCILTEKELPEPLYWLCFVLFLQRFIQYLASRNTLFNLNNFLDKGALQGMLETSARIVSLKHYTQMQWMRHIFVPSSFFLRLWHVHVHQAVQQISERESPFLQTGGCGLHQNEKRVRNLFRYVFCLDSRYSETLSLSRTQSHQASSLLP